MRSILGNPVQIVIVMILLLTMFSSREVVTTRSVFSTLPLKKMEFAKLVEVEGGASNHNYFLKTNSQKIFLRMGNNPQALAEEADVAYKVSEAGFAPELISYSEENMILASKMIDGLRGFCLHDKQNIREVALLIRRLHESDVRFSKTISPKELVASLITEAEEFGVELPVNFEADIDAVLTLRPHFDENSASPCHLDLHKGNLLLDHKRFWIIDWEYAANSDPLFDLAVLSATENFTDEEMLELLTVYGEPEKFERLYYFRMLADARWAIWCLVRGSNATIDFPYEAEFKRYYDSFYQRYSFPK